MPNATQKARLPMEVSLAKAKATLSAVIDGVEQKNRPVTILRRGVPVAQIVPFPKAGPQQLKGSMAGTGRELGDIVSPLGVEWELGEA
jgi:prevent-host-death family protein